MKNMDSDKIRRLVQQAYGQIATDSDSAGETVLDLGASADITAVK
ncbi:MAG: hypothetical protein ACYC4D_05450 [Thermoleophilia bacterium]